MVTRVGVKVKKKLAGGRLPLGKEGSKLPRLRSGFRRAAQTPRRRFNFDFAAATLRVPARAFRLVAPLKRCPVSYFRRPLGLGWLRGGGRWIGRGFG